VDVVVGTQMVAKGHDFPGVRLVGVVLADLGLHIPDFRAAERTFQLLTQVAGRAGRGSAPGRVVVQTFAPKHYAVASVLHHDYDAFYAEEIGHRAALGYPPFGHLVHVLVSGPDEAAARAAAENLAGVARRAGGDAIEVLGPAPAPLARLRDRFRFQLLAKGADAEVLHRTGRALADDAAQLAAPLRAKVDPNPLNML
jgi:primosomal protein N' (replication factor Y)